MRSSALATRGTRRGSGGSAYRGAGHRGVFASALLVFAAFACGDSADTSTEPQDGGSAPTGVGVSSAMDGGTLLDVTGAMANEDTSSNADVSGDIESTAASDSTGGDASEEEGGTVMPPSCPPQDEPCVSAALVAGKCVLSVLPDGTPCGSSTCLQVCRDGVCQSDSVDSRAPVGELRTYGLGGDLPEAFLGEDRFVFLDAGDREGPSSLSLVREVGGSLQLVDQTPTWSLRPELASPWLWTPMYTGALVAIDDTHVVYAASNYGLALYDLGNDALALRSEWPLYADSPEVFDLAVVEDRVWTCGNHRLAEFDLSQGRFSLVRNVPLASICFHARTVGADLLLLTSTGLFVASTGDEVTVTELLRGTFLDLAVGEAYVATRRVANAGGYGDVEVYEREALLAGEAPVPVFVLPLDDVHAASVAMMGDAMLVVENRRSTADDATEWWAQLYSLRDDFAPLGGYRLGADPSDPIAVAKVSANARYAVIHPLRTVLERQGETLRKITGPRQGSLTNLTSVDETTVVALSPTSYHRLEVSTDGAIELIHGGQTDGMLYSGVSILRSPHAEPLVGPWLQQSETAHIPVVAPSTDGLELLGVWRLEDGPANLDGAGGWIHRVAPLPGGEATFRVERFSADALPDGPPARTFELSLPYPSHLVQVTDRGLPRSFTLDGGRSLLIAQQRSDGAAIDPRYGLVVAWIAVDEDEPVLFASATWDDAGNVFAASAEGDTLVVQTVADIRIFRKDGEALREIRRIGAESSAPDEHLSYVLPSGAMQSGLLYVAAQRIDEEGTTHALVAFDIASLGQVAAYERLARPVVQVREVGDWLWLAGISHLWVAEPPCRAPSAAEEN